MISNKCVYIPQMHWLFFNDCINKGLPIEEQKYLIEKSTVNNIIRWFVMWMLITRNFYNQGIKLNEDKSVLNICCFSDFYITQSLSD